MERKIGQTLVKLHRGDITELEVDAIVNAANNRLWMGGGVAGVIRQKGGKEIQREAVAKGPIPVGEAVVTGAGQLKASYVIHAAIMALDFFTDRLKIASATRNSLLRARELGLSRIAFPALGAGVGRFPLDEVARTMLAEVAGHLSQPTSLVEVIFALFDEAAYNAFEQEMERLP